MHRFFSPKTDNVPFIVLLVSGLLMLGGCDGGALTGSNPEIPERPEEEQVTKTNQASETMGEHNTNAVGNGSSGNPGGVADEKRPVDPGNSGDETSTETIDDGSTDDPDGGHNTQD